MSKPSVNFNQFRGAAPARRLPRGFLSSAHGTVMDCRQQSRSSGGIATAPAATPLGVKLVMLPTEVAKNSSDSENFLSDPTGPLIRAHRSPAATPPPVAMGVGGVRGLSLLKLYQIHCQVPSSLSIHKAIKASNTINICSIMHQTFILATISYPISWLTLRSCTNFLKFGKSSQISEFSQLFPIFPNFSQFSSNSVAGRSRITYHASEHYF
jgi:hypothetical protein